jgi:hypothetical protein
VRGRVSSTSFDVGWVESSEPTFGFDLHGRLRSYLTPPPYKTPQRRGVKHVRARNLGTIDDRFPFSAAEKGLGDEVSASNQNHPKLHETESIDARYYQCQKRPGNWRILLMRAVIGLSLLCGMVLPLQADPLTRVPDKAGMVLKIERPRELVERILSIPAWQTSQSLAAIKDALDLPQVRTALEVLHHVEAELGTKWPDLLEQLTSQGVVLATGKLTEKNQKFLLAVEGKNPELLEKLEKLIIKLIDEEFQLRGGNYRPEQKEYNGFQATQWNEDFLSARKGSLLLICNKKEVLKLVLEMPESGESILKLENFAQARTALPKNPLATLWVDFDPIRESDEAKEAYKRPRNDVVQTIAFAGWLDVLGRSPYLSFGLYGDDAGFSFLMKQPAGKEGRAPDTVFHLPPYPKKDGTLPLLQPQGTLYTHSFYLDLGALFTHRDDILAKGVAESFDKGVKEASRITIGTTLEKMVTSVGPHHRVVFTQPAKLDYKVEPQQPFPSVAHIVDLRDPAVKKSLESAYRAIGFVLSNQVTMKLLEQEHKGISILTYRFPEDGKYVEDPTKTRFNFQPSVAITKDRLITASNAEICKQMIDLVSEEADHQFHPENMRLKLIASGGKQLVETSPGPSLSLNVLQLGKNLAEGKKELQKLLNVLDNAGEVEFSTLHGETDFQFKAKWTWKK